MIQVLEYYSKTCLTSHNAAIKVDLLLSCVLNYSCTAEGCVIFRSLYFIYFSLEKCVQGTVFFPHVIEESDKLLIIFKIITFNGRKSC